MDLSPEDIRQATFAEVTEGGLDPVAVRSFLEEVSDHVADLEARINDSNQVRAAALDVLDQAEALVDVANARSAEAETKRTDAEAYAAELEESAARRLDESSRAAAEIFERAKHDAEELVAAAGREVEVLLDEARARAEEVEGAARARAGELEAAAVGALAAAEEETANVVAAARASAENEARQIVDDARARAEGTGFQSYARGLEEAEVLRTEAERTLEHARVEAAVVVARAREELESEAGAAMSTAGRAEVSAMIAEAESLLNEARDRAEAILADAQAQAGELKDRKDLSDEIHRSIGALAAVSAARQTSNESGAVTALRGRALQMVGEMQRIDGELPDEVVETMRREAAEVRGILARLEASLGESGVSSATGTEAVKVVLDLTDRSHLEDAKPESLKPSRYEKRSAHLPSIGSDVDDVSRAVRSMRDQLTDDTG